MEQQQFDFKPVFFGPLVRQTEAPKHPTRTGYGAKIPTQYMVFGGNRWRRVYCKIYSNSGTLFIVVNGKPVICEVNS